MRVATATRLNRPSSANQPALLSSVEQLPLSSSPPSPLLLPPADTTIENVSVSSGATPFVAVTVIGPAVPTSPAAGVPDSRPLVGLSVNHAGRPVALNVGAGVPV